MIYIVWSQLNRLSLCRLFFTTGFNIIGTVWVSSECPSLVLTKCLECSFIIELVWNWQSAGILCSVSLFPRVVPALCLLPLLFWTLTNTTTFSRSLILDLYRRWGLSSWKRWLRVTTISKYWTGHSCMLVLLTLIYYRNLDYRVNVTVHTLRLEELLVDWLGEHRLTGKASVWGRMT